MNKKFIKKLRYSTLGLMMLFLLGISINTNAQFPASSYSFQALGGTYTDLVGGTAFTPVQGDDNCSTTTIPLNFTFNYCGVNYTAVRAGSNGYLTFSTGAASTAGNVVGSLTIISPALFWLWDDLDGATGNASYTTTGTAPNRVFTFQFKNWEWNWSTTGPNISCQVKLYEGTNVIEYQYNPESAAGNPAGSGGASIGICDGAATPTYLSLNNGTATPTASSTAFTVNIATKPAAGQIYRFTPPPPCTTATNLPTSGTVTAGPNSLCLSGNVTLNFTGNVAMPAVTGITYKWQTSPTAAGVYTDIPGAVTTLPTYTTTTPITASAYFKCVVLCTGTTTVLTSAASNQVVVNNPGNPVPTAGSRCGPGTVALSAAAPAATPSATLNWYTAATGGTPIGTGTNFNTPYITSTTNFYVAASGGGVGSPQTLSTTTVGGNGCTEGVMFDIDPNVSLFVDSFKALAAATAQNVPINIYTKTGTYLGNEANAAAWTLVATVNVNTVAGQMVNIPLPTPISITSNVLTGVFIRYNATYTTLAAQTLYSNADLDVVSGAGICTAFTAGGFNPNRGFNGSVHYRTTGCEGNRVPVVATVTTSPVVAKTFPAVVCNQSTAAITLTPPTPAYPSYNWTPAVNLYTNAAATTPYTGGSATSVFMQTSNVGQQTYYLMAGNPAIPTGCTFADTVTVWVQPANVTIKAQPDTICVSGTSILKLDTIAGYYPGSIQWQSSTDGVNYTNIAGATASTYTTATLGFGQNTYYKALVSAGSTICQSPVKYIVVSNPTVISKSDSFNCGPGTVMLKAVTGGNGTPVWYSSASGGAPIGSGSPFETPYLTTTTNFYVVAGGGSTMGTQVLGAGDLTTGTQTYNPFCAGWGGTKIQYLIRASELTALGIPGGSNITSLAMDVVAGGATYPGFAISMKNTTSTVLTATYEAGTTEVFAPVDITPTSNATLPFTFTTPFLWDGTSNVLVQMCWSNGTFGSTGNTVKGNTTTFVATHRGQSDSQTPSAMCGTTAASTNATYSNRPMFRLGYISRCESARQQVVASIYPKPAVDLGQDIDQCFDAGAAYVFDAGVQPNTPQYLWDNGSNSQVRSVTESGAYYVTVTNSYTCATTDTVNINFRVNPVVDLGHDTLVCNGVTLTLDAGTDGHDYFWNTGESGQTINVNAAGSYNVFVTNTQNCITGDTIIVNMAGELPSIAGINVDNNGQYNFQFSAIYPQNVIGYEWDFGDGSTHSYEAAPHHTYADGGNYTVVLRLSSSCGFVNDTLSAHIVGIHQITVSNEDLSVYPNPTKHSATIAVKGALKMEKIEVYNILGQVIYRKNADNDLKHELDLSGNAAGIYTIQIYTDQGTVSRKIEILK